MFELSPSAGGGWTETVLYDFHDGTDGYAPYAGLTLDSAGNLYGTTVYGGIDNCPVAQFQGCGTVFKLSPTVGGGWTETVLHNFNQNGSDGWSPITGLTLDGVGNLYSTTIEGGAYFYGVVFELSPNAGGGWTENLLHTFIGIGSDGGGPAGPLVFDAAGNLYGSTAQGGAYLFGTVFKLTPTMSGPWTETLLHQFGAPDGYLPWGGVIFDSTGNLYGTTWYGGPNQCELNQLGCGTVFELSPVYPCANCSHAALR